ncbi:MAG: decaprenyl-phosphate phosphoribosyltransferase, partial [Anaerolineales bacterium]|nr:decaprenyl-phosphate phosphoribosyltransferase [Anaerolineales bacterium]
MVIQILGALLISMRPKQWMKNVLIFTALVFDEKLLDIQAFLVTFSGFILFCLISSSVYLLNDITDVEADRHHPKKRNRP